MGKDYVTIKDDFLAHAKPGISDQAGYLRSLVVGGSPPFSKNRAVELFRYSAIHQFMDALSLAGVAMELELNFRGVAVLAAKALLEKHLGKERGWTNKNKANLALSSVLARPVTDGEYEEFIERCAGDHERLVDVLVTKYGPAISVPVIAAAEADAALRDAGAVCGSFFKRGVLDGAYSRPNAAGPHRSADQEMKAVANKRLCGDIYGFFSDVRRLEHKLSPFTYKDALFWNKGEEKRFVFIDTGRREEAKAHFVVLQFSFVLMTSDGKVVTVRRDEGKDPKHARITSGLSLLLSFSPNPNEPVDAQVHSYLGSIFSDRDRNFPIRPLAVVINDVAQEPGKLPKDGEPVIADKPPTMRPTYLFFVGIVDLGKDLPEGFEVNPISPKKIHKDTAGVHELSQIATANFKGNADRAVLLALQHPDAGDRVAFGTATLLDLRRGPQADWSFPIPKTSRR